MRSILDSVLFYLGCFYLGNILGRFLGLVLEVLQ